LRKRTKLVALVTALLSLTISQPASGAALLMEVPDSASGEVNAQLDGSTRASALVIPVPELNRITASNTVAITISDLSVGEEVSVSSNNAFLVTKLHTDFAPVSAKDGSNNLTLKSSGGAEVTFYAYTTSSSLGAVTVTTEFSIFTKYLIGRPGPAYNIFLDAPAYLAPGVSAPLGLRVTDVFGNTITDSNGFNPITDLKVAALGGRATAFTFSNSSKRFISALLPRIETGTLVLSIGIEADAIPNLPEPRSLEVRSINVVDLAASIETLTKELALAKAQESMARKAHNKLARKWNKSGGSKVKLMKKPVSTL
jgi:hypothetical protein